MARRRYGEAPASRSGTYGFLADDDPDAEMVIRQHAEATGRDPDEAVREELAVRRSRGRSRNLDEVLTAERARAGSSTSAPATPARRPAAAGGHRRRRAGSSRFGHVGVTPPGRWSGADGAGFLLGLFLYALALNTVRFGPAGAKAWLSAKFLNKPDVGMVAR